MTTSSSSSSQSTSSPPPRPERPQHLADVGVAVGRARASASATALLLFASSLPSGVALAIAPTATIDASTGAIAVPGTLADRIRTIRAERPEGGSRALVPLPPFAFDARSTGAADSEALLCASLFDDVDFGSLEGALASLDLGPSAPPPSSSSAKDRAEAYDRLAAEDLAAADAAREAEAVRRGRGLDVAGTDEESLRREAAERRRRGLEGASFPSSSEASKRAPEPSTKQISDESSSSSSPSSALLTREREYALARTIQAGAQLHKLRAEAEAERGTKLTKKEWASLASLGPNDLRKLVADYRDAKRELVSSNLGLVRAVARTHARKAKFRGVDVEELIQEGAVGLVRAAELFDPERGLRFSTYATIWIKGVLSNSDPLGGPIVLPARERALRNKVRRAREEIALERGALGAGDDHEADASAEELARRVGSAPAEVERHLRRASGVSNVLSLDYEYANSSGEGQRRTLAASLSCATDADLAEHAALRADVVTGLARGLTEREAALVRLRYGLEDGRERTIRECADEMGINRETARLLQHACLRKLKEARSMESLQEYLLTVA